MPLDDTNDPKSADSRGEASGTDGEGFGNGLMGSGGSSWVVVAFISPLNLDVRRLAARILSDTGRGKTLASPSPSKPVPDAGKSAAATKPPTGGSKTKPGESYQE